MSRDADSAFALSLETEALALAGCARSSRPTCWRRARIAITGMRRGNIRLMPLFGCCIRASHYTQVLLTFLKMPHGGHVRSSRSKSRRQFIGGEVITLIAAIGSAAQAASMSVALPGAKAYPESITSTADGTLYISSIGAGGIYRAEPGASRAQIWIKPGAMGSRSTFGVLADERSGTLWVCSNDLSSLGIGTSIASQKTGSWLEGFDLKTGAGKTSAELPGKYAFCNDIAVGPDGSVYVTDSGDPDILKLSADGKSLEVWATDHRFKPSKPPPKATGLDGIAVGSDGNVYVDTFTSGDFYRVEVKDGKPRKITRLKSSRKLIFPDALRPISRNTFLLIEGGGRLDRVVVFGDSVEVHTIKGGFSWPTGVTLVDGNTAWVSVGQLGYLFNANEKAQGPRLPFRAYGVPLTRNK